jgi:hypothetical protein
VSLALHASAAYVDPISDRMYLVLDQDFEPDDALLPIPPVFPAYVDGRTIHLFEGDPVTLMTYSWRTKLYLDRAGTFYWIARVRAESYDNLVVRFYGDGILLDTIVVTDGNPFTLTPPAEAYETFEMELVGTDTVRVIQVSDVGVEELS